MATTPSPPPRTTTASSSPLARTLTPTSEPPIGVAPAPPSRPFFCSSSSSSPQPTAGGGEEEEAGGRRRLLKQSSWEATDAEGDDYLYRLGKEADNMNIAVGARRGIVDDLFVGNFIGKDSDIVFDYRQKATRTFEYLQGDYYIAPLFLDKVGKQFNVKRSLQTFLQSACHIVKNYIAHLLNIKIPLVLGIWGGKGQGKTFQTKLIFRALSLLLCLLKEQVNYT